MSCPITARSTRSASSPPGPLPEPIDWRGVKLGVPICEDIWLEPVCAHLAEAGADLLLVPNGSPYEIDKDDLRQQLVRAAGDSRPACRWPTSTASAGRTNWPSTARASSSTPTASSSCRCPTGTRRCCVTDWARGRQRLALRRREQRARARSLPAGHLPRDDGRACATMSTRNGFPGVILGLSGGIDSALSAAVAVDALGRRQGVVRDAAVQIYVGRKPRRRRENARDCSACAMTSSRSSRRRCAGADAARTCERPRRREYPVAAAHGDADGAVATRSATCC